MNRKDTEKKRKKSNTGLTATDRICHSLELSDLDMPAVDFDDCIERFRHTFGKGKK